VNIKKPIQHYPRRLTVATLIALAGCVIIACSPESKKRESVEFTADELYFIEAYVEVRRARSYYPEQPAVAESLFTELEAKVDTTRVAHTIAALNLDPDRWAAVYGEIEKRLRDVARSRELERSGAAPGTPAQVE
jgi:hypothetical protein